MNVELETRFLEIDKNEIIKKLEDLGAMKVNNVELLQRRYVYDFNPKISNKWIRLRTDGIISTLTIKEVKEKTIDGTTELEIIVSDFDKTNEILKQLGYNPRAYQENKRITYTIDNLSVMIDTWPLIPSYIEIEGHTIEDIENLIKKLQLNLSKRTELDVQSIYEEVYKINIDDYKELKFDI